MAQIIKLNTNPNSKDFNREKFEISIKKEIEIKKQNECKHIEIEVDSDEDLHNCLECGKKFTAHEYLVFKALDNSRIKFHSYTLKNDIHFLEQEKVQLENFVNDLKSQKHKLSSWITRTKNKNNINFLIIKCIEFFPIIYEFKLKKSFFTRTMQTDYWS